MIRIILALVVTLAAFIAMRKFQTLPPEQKAKLSKTLFYAFLGIAFLLLAGTGHLNWLFALIGVVAAFAMRMMPVILRYAPYLHRIWQEYMYAKQYSTGQQGGKASPKGGMSKDEAYEVLGLKPGATEEEIITAHRKLMQKIHPDRGGSDYLAAQINLAKKILLNK